MPLRERMAVLEKSVPPVLNHRNVQMLTNPTSTGKKLLAVVTKAFGEFEKNVKFLDATIANIEKAMRLVVKASFEEHDALFKNIDGLMRQCAKAKSLVAKNVTDLEKALPGLKKQYGIK